MLRGQKRDTTILQLKDATFTDAKKPQAIMWCSGFGSAGWFHNNIENLTNDGGSVWILGYKTEHGGTLAHTLNGGKTEILGGFSYTTTAGMLAPIFANEDEDVWTFFGEICYNQDPFTTLVRETRDGQTKEITPGPAAPAETKRPARV